MMRRLALCLLAFIVAGYCQAALPANEIRMLLVGVGQYAPKTVGVKPLDGPINDVAAVEAGLRQRLGATSTLQIRTLNDSSATRAGILHEIETFLGAAQPGSTAILYFSGHGSRVYGMYPHKPDRYDSTILPYDARVEGQPNRDIRDVELGKVLAPLDRKGVHVVVILDSCFAGGGTRIKARSRFAAPADNVETGETTAPDATTPLLEPKVLFRSGRKLQMVFSASDSKTVAYESPDEKGVVMGDFTRAFVASLVSGPRVMTYHELEFGIRSHMRKLPREQEPYSEGDRDRLAFEAGGLRGRLVIEASRLASGRYTIAAGELVGITKGSEYAAYDTASNAAFSKEPPLAKGNIRSVTLGGAELAFEGSKLPKTLFVTETAHVFTGEPLRVWLDDAFGGLSGRLAVGKSSVTGVTLTDREVAEVALVLDNGIAYAASPSGSRVRLGVANSSLEGKQEAYLRAAARAKSLTSLRHDDVAVDAGFRVMIADPTGGDMLEPERRGGAYVLHDGDKIYVCFENRRSSSKLFFYLLSLSPENELHVLYPPSSQGAGTALAEGAAHPSDDFDVSRSGTDLLKLIVTNAEISSYVLDRLQNDGQRSAGETDTEREKFSALELFLSDASRGARTNTRPMVQTWATREALVEVLAQPEPRDLKPAAPCR